MALQSKQRVPRLFQRRQDSGHVWLDLWARLVVLSPEHHKAVARPLEVELPAPYGTNPQYIIPHAETKTVAAYLEEQGKRARLIEVRGTWPPCTARRARLREALSRDGWQRLSPQEHRSGRHAGAVLALGPARAPLQGAHLPHQPQGPVDPQHQDLQVGARRARADRHGDDVRRAGRGREVYAAECASCHDFGAKDVGQVTQQARAREAVVTGSPKINMDAFAKPFTFVRSLFSAEPNPDLVRRLSLAGYRNPSHADIFLGARLALPAILGFGAAFLFRDNVIIFFLMAVVIGFFAPDFWLSHAINSRREQLKLSLPDGLDLLSICLEAGLGLDQGIVRVGQELRDFRQRRYAARPPFGIAALLDQIQDEHSGRPRINLDGLQRRRGRGGGAARARRPGRHLGKLDQVSCHCGGMTLDGCLKSDTITSTMTRGRF